MADRTQPEARPQEGGCRRWAIGASIFCVLVMVVLVLVIRARFTVFSAYSDYPAAAKAYRDAGLPWTAEELTGPTLPVDQNAAAQYLLIEKSESVSDVSNGFPGGPSKGPSFPDLKGLLSKQDLPQVEAYLSLQEAQLSKLPALQKLSCQWSHDWAAGSFALFPECSRLKGWAKSLALRAEMKMLKGDSRGAVEDLNLAAHLAKDLEKGYTIIHILSGNSAEAIVLSSARKCASMAPANESFLNEMIALCDSLSRPIKIRNVLRGEAFLNFQSFRFMNLAPRFLDRLQKGPHRQDSSSKAGPDVQGFVNQSYAARYLRKWASLYSLFSKGEEEDLVGFQKHLPVQMEEWQDEEMTFDEGAELPKMMDAGYYEVLTQGSWRQFIDAVLQARARALAHRTLFALALDQRLNRQTPPIKVPQDPFGDGPLKTSISVKEVKVWSCGLDRDNDRGVAKIIDPNQKPLKKGDPPRPAIPPNGDIVAELPWKPNLAPNSASQPNANP